MVLNGKKCYVIYNMRAAGYLMLKGIPLIKMEQNRKFPDKNVYIFEESELIHNLVDEYHKKMSENSEEE